MQIAISLILIWLAHFLVDFMLGVWSVYKTMAGLDLALAGLIASSAAFMGEGSQLLFGNLSDKGYGKRLIVVGVILAAASAFLSFVSAYFLIFFLFLTTCIGSGAFHPSAVSFIGSLTEKQKGLFIGIFASGGALGMAISQMVFSKWHTYFDGNTIPLVIPSMALAFVLLLFGFFSKQPTQNLANKRPSLGIALFKEYFKNRSLKMLYILQVCNQTIFWASIFLLPDVLVSRGYDASVAYGGGHFAFIIGSVLTMIPFGYMADSLSPRIVIIWSTLIGMVLFLTFLLSPMLTTPYLLTLLFFTGALLGVVQPLSVALGNDLGRSSPGMVSAFTMGLVWVVSETIGPLGSGLLSTFFSEDAPAKALLVFGMLFPLQLYASLQLPSLAMVSQELVE